MDLSRGALPIWHPTLVYHPPFRTLNFILIMYLEVLAFVGLLAVLERVDVGASGVDTGTVGSTLAEDCE